MRQIFGIICQLLALLGAMGAVRVLVSGDSVKRGGNTAYDAGQKIGRTIAMLSP